MATITTGLAITYQSGFLAEIIDYEDSGMERAVIDTTHMGTTGARSFLPSTLYDPGELTVELQFDPEQDPTTPMSAAAETVTVTYADSSPASTMACSGFMTNFSIRGGLEDRMEATATLKLTGSRTHG